MIHIDLARSKSQTRALWWQRAADESPVDGVLRIVCVGKHNTDDVYDVLEVPLMEPGRQWLLVNRVDKGQYDAYEVTVFKGNWSCTCPGFRAGGRDCKHKAAMAALLEVWRGEAEGQPERRPKARPAADPDLAVAEGLPSRDGD